MNETLANVCYDSERIPKHYGRLRNVERFFYIGRLEAKIWAAADTLRNNLDAAEYKHAVLGLIFLKNISDASEASEYAVNCLHGPHWTPYRAWMRRSLRLAGMRLGFSITANVFGPGLSLPHWGTIVVHPEARIGARCRVHPGALVGWHRGGVPKIGDDCYLGNGCKIFGDKVLGDRTVVGAGCLVTRSYPEGAWC